jgi:hypothetical protein
MLVSFAYGWWVMDAGPRGGGFRGDPSREHTPGAGFVSFGCRVHAAFMPR